MKKTLSIIVLMVLVWGCSHKITPAASGNSAGGSNAGSPATAPAVGTVAANPAPTSSTGASKTTPETTPATASSPEMLGQSTFNTKCSRCHALKVTTDYTADRWISIMQVMANKARLDDTEKENVLAYVKANAKK